MNGRRFLSRAGQAFKAEMGWFAKEAMQDNLDFFTNPVVTLKFYFPDRRKRDVDNCIKVTLDSLSHIVYEDDSSIRELHAFKFVDPARPRIWLRIEERLPILNQYDEQKK